MTNSKPKIIDGRLQVDSFPVNRLLLKNVTKNNGTSGKVTVPKDLIGKKVYVVWEN